jgi:hypothetical protein
MVDFEQSQQDNELLKEWHQNAKVPKFCFSLKQQHKKFWAFEVSHENFATIFKFYYKFDIIEIMITDW